MINTKVLTHPPTRQLQAIFQGVLIPQFPMVSAETILGCRGVCAGPSGLELNLDNKKKLYVHPFPYMHAFTRKIIKII